MDEPQNCLKNGQKWQSVAFKVEMARLSNKP